MIQVRNLSKVFHIPHVKKQTLFHTLTSLAKETYDYEEFYALRDISFSVKNGEFLGVIGRNGSGKSTLMKILSRVYLPTSGEVIINDEVYPLLELGLGFQPDFTVRDNIYLYGAFLGFSRPKMKSKLDHILAWTELERFSDAKLDKLSNGMRMRLGFAIAIQSVAPIVIADEILAVGDKFFVQKCRKVFKEFKEEGKTVVLVSHDMESIKEFCDRALVMHEGKLIGDGQPKEMVDLYLNQLSMVSEGKFSPHDGTGVTQPTTIPSQQVEIPATARIQTITPPTENPPRGNVITTAIQTQPISSVPAKVNIQIPGAGSPARDAVTEKVTVNEKPTPAATTTKPDKHHGLEQKTKAAPPPSPAQQGYNAKEFWEKRLTENFSLQGVGNIMFDSRYNEYLYRQRLAVLKHVLRKYKISPSKKNVLDLGCGNGYFTQYYLLQGARVVGVDIAPVCINRLKEQFPKGEFHLNDITSEKFRLKKSFDIVHFFGTAFHIVDDAKFDKTLVQCNKLLKVGGYLFITDLFEDQDRPLTPHVKFRCYSRYKVLENYGIELLEVIPMHFLMNKKFKRISIEAANKYAPLLALADSVISTMHLSSSNDVKFLVAKKHGKQQR